MRILRIIVPLAALVIGAASARNAAAQADFPNRPVRIIVDSAPGSANDVLVRLVGDRLSAIWGQQVITVNQPGATGAIATRAASSAPPDGYTLYLAGASTFLALAGAPGVAANLPIELPRDFVPIGMTALQPMFVCVSPALGVNSLSDLLALARKKPGEVTYGATGRGRITHLTMELLQKLTDTKMQLVAYTGGPAQAMTDVIAGRVSVVLDGYAGVVSGLQGGQTKAIFVTSPQRLKEFPDLAAGSETVPGFQSGGWNVILAPLGTPAPVASKIATDLNKALEDGDLHTKLANIGAFVQHMTPAEVVAFSQQEQKTWRPVLEQLAKETP